MHSTIIGGSNFTLHAAGWLEGGLATGFEKLIIDADRLGGYQKLLGGLDMDDNALGKTAYDDVAPAGHFLGSAHTLANYETAYYDAEMSDNESCEKWEDEGSRDTARRAFERWNAMLEEYAPPPMDEAKDEELRAFVAKRKASMEDAWY
jgi:trimethylamine--corrinoid protein Co-methyltransferase